MLLTPGSSEVRALFYLLLMLCLGNRTGRRRDREPGLGKQELLLDIRDTRMLLFLRLLWVEVWYKCGHVTIYQRACYTMATRCPLLLLYRGRG